jgi:hypothetical protein
MIPTAKEFLKQEKSKQPNRDYTSSIMISFAKMHVKEALEQVEQSIHINATCNICCSGSEIGFNENPIVNAYPLDRIE